MKIEKKLFAPNRQYCRYVMSKSIAMKAIGMVSMLYMRHEGITIKTMA